MKGVFHTDLTAGALRLLLVDYKEPKAKPSRGTSPSAARFKLWTPGSDYRCIREGVPISDKAEMLALFKTKELTERYMWLFAHKESMMQINEETPRFEAVYYSARDQAFFLMLKSHLKLLYTKMGRCSFELATTRTEDGSPYWVDRYIVSKTRQLENKRERQKKKRKKSNE
jgi:hypothetical protein